MRNLCVTMRPVTLFSLLLLVKLAVCKLESDGLSAVFNTEEWKLITTDVGSSGASDDNPPKASNSWRDPDTQIFVSIVEYRDSRCPITLRNLFTKAKNPNRLVVGLVQQVHTEKDKTDCLKAYCTLMGGSECPHFSQIRSIIVAHHDARGPATAHHIGEQLLGDEEFCMQTDSHSDMAHDWDTALLSMWGSIDNEYAVLSTAVPDISTIGINVNERYEVPHLCQAGFAASGLVRNLLPRAAMNLEKPLLAPLWSSSFSFSKCHAEKKTPADPYYPHIIDGDEFAKYARLWTRGYDVYTPSRTIIGQDLTKSMFRYAPRLTDEKENKDMNPMEWIRYGMTPEFSRHLYERGVERMGSLLGYPLTSFPDVVSSHNSLLRSPVVQAMSPTEQKVEMISLLTKYGLGSKRTLEQLMEFTGVDIRASVIFGDRCKQLHWVPFVKDEDPSTQEGDPWGMSPELHLGGGRDIPLASGSVSVGMRGVHVTVADQIKRAAMLDGPHAIRLSSDKTNKDKIDRIELRIKEDMNKVEKKVEGELWWIFQHVDIAVEQAILFIDTSLGAESSGHGYKVIKLILLGAPVFVAITVLAAWWVITGGGTVKHVARNDAKRI